MIAYYTKYFPGNFFVNYAILSFADSVSMIYITLLSFYVRGVKNVVRINLIVICVFSVIYILFVSRYPILVTLGIFILRVCLNGILSFVYHMNQALFPTEFRSLASGSMNFVSRLFAASALIAVEYTSMPIVFVLTINLAVLVSSNGLIHEPKSKKTEFQSGGDSIPHSFEDSLSNFNASDNYSR
jgi:hypothetical protein